MKKRASRRKPRRGLRALSWALGVVAFFALAILGDRAYNRRLHPQAPIVVLGCGVGSSSASGREAEAFEAWQARVPGKAWQAWIVRGFGPGQGLDLAFFAVGDQDHWRLFRAQLEPPSAPVLLLDLPHAPAQAATHALRLDLLRQPHGESWILVTETYRGGDTLHVFQRQDPEFKEVWTYGDWGQQHPGQVEGWALAAVADGEIILYQSSYGRDDVKPSLALKERIFLQGPRSLFYEKHSHPITLAAAEATLASAGACGVFGRLALPGASQHP